MIGLDCTILFFHQQSSSSHPECMMSTSGAFSSLICQRPLRRVLFRANFLDPLCRCLEGEKMEPDVKKRDKNLSWTFAAFTRYALGLLVVFATSSRNVASSDCVLVRTWKMRAVKDPKRNRTRTKPFSVWFNSSLMGRIFWLERLLWAKEFRFQVDLIDNSTLGIMLRSSTIQHLQMVHLKIKHRTRGKF